MADVPGDISRLAVRSKLLRTDHLIESASEALLKENGDNGDDGFYGRFHISCDEPG